MTVSCFFMSQFEHLTYSRLSMVLCFHSLADLFMPEDGTRSRYGSVGVQNPSVKSSKRSDGGIREKEYWRMAEIRERLFETER